MYNTMLSPLEAGDSRAVVLVEAGCLYLTFYCILTFAGWLAVSRQLTAPVKTSKLVPVTHYDDSITSRLAKNFNQLPYFVEIF